MIMNDLATIKYTSVRARRDNTSHYVSVLSLYSISNNPKDSKLNKLTTFIVVFALGDITWV